MIIKNVGKKIIGNQTFRLLPGKTMEVKGEDVYKRQVCRGWDLAATDKDEDNNAAYTAGVLIGKRKNGQFVVLDVINRQIKAGEVRKLIMMTAKMDQEKYRWVGLVRQRLPQDPGQAGKDQAQGYAIMLSGYDVKFLPESGDKETRAAPMAAQWQMGNFDVMTGAVSYTHLGRVGGSGSGKGRGLPECCLHGGQFKAGKSGSCGAEQIN